MGVHQRWINTCQRLAYKNNKAYPYHYAAIVTKGGKIISIGYNRIKNNRYSRNETGNSSYRCKTTHCEIDALQRACGVNGATLYLVGLTKAYHYANSKPCLQCQQVIVKYFDQGLKAVYYSTPEGIELYQN